MNMRQVGKTMAGLTILIVLVIVVAGWWGDYRAASRRAAPQSAQEATETPQGGGTTEETSQPEPADSSGEQTLLLIQVDGLNFREKASGTSKAFRGLKKGEKVILIAEEGDWYKVQDADGQVGYVTAKASYTTKVTE